MSFCQRFSLNRCETDTASDHTGFNDFPIGWKRITKTVFITMLDIPVEIEYRQMCVKYDENGVEVKVLPFLKHVKAYLYWFADNTGCAIIIKKNRKGMRYARFGCEHKYIPIPREIHKDENNDHFKCGKCSHYYTISRSK